jgi:hypothetical protein
MKIVIHDSHINLDNKNYFCFDGLVQIIGDYGDKRGLEPNPAKHGINKHGEMGQAAFKGRPKIVHSYGPYDYTIDSSVKGGFNAAFKAGLKVLTLDGHASVGAYAGKQDQLRLTLLAVDLDPMASVISGAGVKGKIKDIGNDARVVHRAIVATDGTLSEYLGGGASFDVKEGAGPLGIEVVVDAKTQRNTLEFDETCIGYGLMKFDWDHDRVVNPKDDVWTI